MLLRLFPANLLAEVAGRLGDCLKRQGRVKRSEVLLAEALGRLPVAGVLGHHDQDLGHLPAGLAAQPDKVQESTAGERAHTVMVTARSHTVLTRL